MWIVGASKAYKRMLSCQTFAETLVQKSTEPVNSLVNV